jgi:putative tricarboxylic transport membrane protein
MEKYDRISSIFFLLFGIFILVGARNYAFGTFQEPGGGLYPTLIGGILVVMSIFLMLQTRHASAGDAPEWDWKGGGLRRCLLTLVGLLIVPFLFNVIGFFPTMFLFILCMMKVILSVPWISALTTSIIGTVGGYFLFESWLKIQFPRGILGL